MIKSTLPKIIFASIAVLSLISFIYLNTVQPDFKTVDNSEQYKSFEEEEESSEVSLPDLEVVKKILQNSKRILTQF